MEHLPPRSPDEEPRGPEDEQLYRGEIDLTGTTRQDDALADVIGDAIAEDTAEDGTGEVPDWGARSLARALANVRDDPLSGDLHHFAVTGRADPEAIARELADLYQATTDEQVKEWINWLGTYVIRMPDNAEATEPANSPDDDAPDLGTSPEELAARLRDVFADADARAEAIPASNARAIATVLSIFLDPDSEMAHFADTGDANPVQLHHECQLVRQRTEDIPGMATSMDTWIRYFEQHLAARTDLGRQPDWSKPTASERYNEQQPPSRHPVEANEVPVSGTPLEQVTAYLRITFSEADTRGGSISRDDAIVIAGLLADLLGPDSEMKSFSETGDADLSVIHEECQVVLQRYGQTTPDLQTWVQRLEQHLAPPSDRGRPAELSQNPAQSADDAGTAENPAVEQGSHEHRETPPPAIADTLAHAEQDGLSEQEARNIARFLATYPEVTTDALHDYGSTGTPKHADVIRELFDLYVASDTEHQQLVRALGSRFIWQATEAEMIQDPATADQAPDRHRLLTPANFRMLLGLEAHSHAFIAYLQLHDVDPYDDLLLHGFQDAYLGSYGTYAELLQAFRMTLIDSGELDDRDPAVLDEVSLMRFARRAWDIVEVGDRFYVFHK